jgi:uncharacterized RDD family membrane protein YckC
MLNSNLEYESRTTIGPSLRMMTAAIDGLIICAITFTMAFFLFVCAFSRDVPKVYWAAVILPSVLYLTPEVVVGKSFGKWLLNVAIVSRNGQTASSAVYLSRWILKTLPIWMLAVAISSSSTEFGNVVMIIAAALMGIFLIYSAIRIPLSGFSVFDSICGTVVARTRN